MVDGLSRVTLMDVRQDNIKHFREMEGLVMGNIPESGSDRGIGSVDTNGQITT